MQKSTWKIKREWRKNKLDVEIFENVIKTFDKKPENVNIPPCGIIENVIISTYKTLEMRIINKKGKRLWN